MRETRETKVRGSRECRYCGSTNLIKRTTRDTAWKYRTSKGKLIEEKTTIWYSCSDCGQSKPLLRQLVKKGA